jgi:Fe-S cluster biogenesis protein NfuA
MTDAPPTTCPACKRQARLLSTGLCRSCNLHRYTLDEATEARLAQVVAENKDKPPRARARRQRHVPKGQG